MLRRVQFETERQPRPVSPNRADIACFVGFVDVRAGTEPSMADEPVPVESWDAFAHRFETTHPAIGDQPGWQTPMASAVSDFFRQGGRRCWIASAGPALPPPLRDGSFAETVLDRLDQVVPGVRPRSHVDAGDRGTWRGIGGILGLPEVSLLCLPDLPYLVAGRTEPTVLPEEAGPRPLFVECAQAPFVPPAATASTYPSAPRVSSDDLGRWVQALRVALRFLDRHRPDVQLIAALPLPGRDHPLALDPLQALLDEGHLTTATGHSPGIATTNLQLAYPWARGDGTSGRPGRLAAPDGLLVGILARNALGRGTFRAALGARAHGIHDLEPRLSATARLSPRPVTPGSEHALSLEDRVCLFERSGGSGVVLTSDVTTSPRPEHRQGNVRRLIGVVRRAATRVGESVTFEPSGRDTWRFLEHQLDATLSRIQAAGGLSGRPGEPAFRVRCDQTTMTQADLDAGRLVASIRFRPAYAIERVLISLTARDGSASTRTSGDLS